MEKIKFTIKGNQEKETGNPIPYLRTTQNNQWTDQAKRYQAWQDYVIMGLFDHSIDLGTGAIIPNSFFVNLQLRITNGKKPIELIGNHCAKMDIIIHWANEGHGDPDNIFKGIADSLFENDKHVSGSFKFVHDGKGEVEVSISFYKQIIKKS